MITVKLSAEEYNMLYVACQNIYFFVKRLKDDFVLIGSDSESPILHIKANLPEGKILSHYTNCILRGYKSNRGISFCNVCEDDYCDCENYDYCDGCKLGISESLKMLDFKIENVIFVDPIANRSSGIINSLKEWSGKIASMDEYFSSNPDEDVKRICMTAKLLETQLKNLYDKWSYRNY